MLSLEAASLIRDYPDMPSEVLFALIDIRDDMSSFESRFALFNFRMIFLSMIYFFFDQWLDNVISAISSDQRFTFPHRNSQKIVLKILVLWDVYIWRQRGVIPGEQIASFNFHFFLMVEISFPEFEEFLIP